MIKVGEFGHIEMDGEPSKSDVLIAVGMAIAQAEAGYGCNHCLNRGNEFEGEYCSGDWPHCDHEDPKIYNRMNLKTFPFRNAPKDCFDVKDYVLPYAYVSGFYAGKDDKRRWRAGVLLWQASDRFGLIKLRPENEKRAREAFATFCDATGYAIEREEVS